MNCEWKMDTFDCRIFNVMDFSRTHSTRDISYKPVQRKLRVRRSIEPSSVREVKMIMSELRRCCVDNLDRLIEVTGSDWFTLQDILYEPEFMHWIRDSLVSFSNGELSEDSVVKVLMLLNNIWYVNSFDNALLDDGVISEVGNLCLSTSDIVSAYCFSAMANLAGYIPEVFDGIAVEERVHMRIRKALESESATVMEPSLRFLIAYAEKYSEVMGKFIPFLEAALRSKLPEIKSNAARFLRLLIEENEENFEAVVEEITLLGLSEAMAYGCDVTRTYDFYGIFLIFMKHGIFEHFEEESFLSQVTSTIIQSRTVDACELYCVIHELIVHNWRLMYDYGVIESMIRNSRFARFGNKRFICLCLIDFFEMSDDTEIVARVSLSGGFELLCETIGSFDESDMDRVFDLILKFFELSNRYRAIAEAAELPQALEMLDFENPELYYTRDVVVDTMTEEVEPNYIDDMEVEDWNSDDEVVDDGPHSSEAEEEEEPAPGF